MRVSEIESFVRFIGPVSLLLVEIKSFLGFFMLGLLDLANSYCMVEYESFLMLLLFHVRFTGFGKLLLRDATQTSV